MLIVLANMFVFPFTHHHKKQQLLLNLFSVMCGPRLFAASLVINTILPYSDDFTYYAWTFPLRQKSEVAQTIKHFHAYVRTQFGRPVRALQSDNGREFNNTALRSFYSANGNVLRLSCPYMSPQNGKVERILRMLNDGVQVLLLQAALRTSGLKLCTLPLSF